TWSLGINLGTGTGTFGSTTTYATNTVDFGNHKLADMNGDGVVDLLTSGTLAVSPDFSIRLGRGDGTFGAASSTNLTASYRTATSLSVGDLNGDGVTDVVAAGYYGDGNYTGVVGVLIGNTRDGISPLQPFSLKSRGDALQALGVFSRTAKNLTDIRSNIGATQSRLGTAMGGLVTAREQFIAANSRIMDADIAEQSAKLIRTQILQQAGAAVLASANVQPQLALRLLS
ncbi:MAG: hypothetical protein EBZ48_09210, partial [Proteobacteria bacterium]|nr:hypothetical protein [Pseudomonadota bacterium]